MEINQESCGISSCSQNQIYQTFLALCSACFFRKYEFSDYLRLPFQSLGDAGLYVCVYVCVYLGVCVCGCLFVPFKVFLCVTFVSVCFCLCMMVCECLLLFNDYFCHLYGVFFI